METPFALCHPSDPLQLWEMHRDNLIADFLCQFCPVVSEHKALAEIQQTLLLHQKTCQSIGLPTPPTDVQGGNLEIYDAEEQHRIGQNCTLNSIFSRYLHLTVSCTPWTTQTIRTGASSL